MEIKTVLVIISTVFLFLALLSLGAWRRKLKGRNISSSLRWLIVSCIMWLGFSYTRSLYSGFIYRDSPVEEAGESMGQVSTLLTASDVLIQTAVMSLLFIIPCVCLYLYNRNKIKAQ